MEEEYKREKKDQGSSTGQHITFYFIMSCQLTHLIFYYIILYYVRSCHITSYNIILSHIIPFNILLHRIMSRHIIPSHILLNHIMSLSSHIQFYPNPSSLLLTPTPTFQSSSIYSHASFVFQPSSISSIPSLPPTLPYISSLHSSSLFTSISFSTSHLITALLCPTHFTSPDLILL